MLVDLYIFSVVFTRIHVVFMCMCIIYIHCQIRTWKRSLYKWADEEPSESANTSFCNSDAESVDGDQENDVDQSKPILASLKEIEVNEQRFSIHQNVLQ